MVSPALAPFLSQRCLTLRNSISSQIKALGDRFSCEKACFLACARQRVSQSKTSSLLPVVRYIYASDICQYVLAPV